MIPLFALLRAPFIRQVGSYIAVAVVAAVLYATLAPPRVVVKTQTVETVVSAVAPEYARRYMNAMCAFDAEYLTANTAPTFATSADVANFVVASQRAGWVCGPPKYLGSYQTIDSHAFVVVIGADGQERRETFYVLTFDPDRMVIGIE